MRAATVADVREAFIDSGLVTAGQWADAAARAESATAEAVLSRLESVPAVWANDPAIKAVTPYHTKLVAVLAQEGLLAHLPRRLRWGRFPILSELGRGGMGVVVLAWDVIARRLVALKRVRSASREVRSRFQREGEVLARLCHDNIARFLGTEHIDGADVLVMEFVPGVTASRTQRRLAKQGRVLPCETAANWATQTLSALTHAHEQRIIHRDIKPGNLMVLPDGRGIKLLDMGLAKSLDQRGGEELTQDGQALGTREYMPPEQWQGETAITPAADLYALGCTLFSLLAGRSPFVGETSYRQMMQHISAPIPSVRELRPDVPAAVDQVIQRMMAKNPAHRGTAREIHWILSCNAAAVAPRTGPAVPVVRIGRPNPASTTERTEVSSACVSARSATRASDTLNAIGTTQTTLSGSSCWQLAVELATETGRLVSKWTGSKSGGASLTVMDPARRVREVSGELSQALWDGLRGRRPDAARPAWCAVGGVVIALAALVRFW